MRSRLRLISLIQQYGEGIGDLYRVLIRTHKDRTGKYGRDLVTLIGYDKDGTEVNFNDTLLTEGLAVRYE